MVDAVTDYLRKNGPSLSTDVAEHITSVYRLPPPTARKRVSRARGDVRRLAYLPFPHKARFMYLQKDFGSPLYWAKLTDALLKTNSAYGYAIAALRQREGITPEKHFKISCGAPIKQLKHLSPDTIYSRLNEAGLLQKINIPGIGDCVTLTQGEGRYEWQSEFLRASLITENILLCAVKDWLKKLGITSYDKCKTRENADLPMVGTFAWDLTGPSYLGNMIRTSKDGSISPGFVACDVYLGHVTRQGVAPFVKKCRTLRSLRNVAPCMQIFVADRFDNEAFNYLKENGIIPATPSNLFGEEVALGLKQLTQVLHKAALDIFDPAAFDELFKKLGKIEGASNQLRGTLFEYLTAEVARNSIASQITMNKIFKVLDEKAEADVVAVDPNHSITLIECKGYNPMSQIPDDLFLRWLQHNVPTCFKSIKAHPDWKNLTVNFEFWATAPLSPEAMKIYEEAHSKINASRYTIKLRLGAEIQALCKSTKDDSLITAFQKHFVIYKNPRQPSKEVGIFSDSSE